jgi:hypothetical protein
MAVRAPADAVDVGPTTTPAPCGAKHSGIRAGCRALTIAMPTASSNRADVVSATAGSSCLRGPSGAHSARPS